MLFASVFDANNTGKELGAAQQRQTRLVLLEGQGHDRPRRHPACRVHTRPHSYAVEYALDTLGRARCAATRPVFSARDIPIFMI